MIKAQFGDLEFFGATAFPTSTGEGLYFSEMLAKGELIIEEWQRSEDAESPIDVVKTRFRVGVQPGVWSLVR